MRELADVQRSVLVVIDLQGKLASMVHRSELVLDASKRLMQAAELFGVPVLVTEQYPRGLGHTAPELMEVFDGLSVPRKVVEKTSFGCCGEPAFEEALRELRPGVEPADRQLVVAGIEAHVCVLQTVLASIEAGSQVHLCWEAVSGRGSEYREWALERMQQAGARITNHESVGFEWARDKDHPQFKAWSKLLQEGQLVG